MRDPPSRVLINRIAQKKGIFLDSSLGGNRFSMASHTSSRTGMVCVWSFCRNGLSSFIVQPCVQPSGFVE